MNVELASEERPAPEQSACELIAHAGAASYHVTVSRIPAITRECWTSDSDVPVPGTGTH